VSIPPHPLASHECLLAVNGVHLDVEGLAAMVVYLIMINLSKSDEVQAALWQADGISAVFASLHEISTSYEIVGSGSHAESLAAAAARQNQDAQAVPLSSKEWAALALAECPDFKIGTSSPSQVETLKRKLAKVLNLYNDRPDIILSANSEADRKAKRARKCDDDGDDIGLIIGSKRTRTMEQFLMNSTPGFWASIEKHFHEHSFAKSCWTERIWNNKNIWMRSTVEYNSAAVFQNTPPPEENSSKVDWGLPMSQKAHEAFAERMALDYERATATILNPDKKTMLRKNDQAVMKLRNVLAFFYQPCVHDLIKSVVDDAAFKDYEDCCRGSVHLFSATREGCKHKTSRRSTHRSSSTLYV